MEIEKLVEKYPNDMELGAKVREIYWENRKKYDSLMKKMESSKIYESPDGGHTIYERPWGSDVSQRKLVTTQLNLFDDSDLVVQKSEN